MQHTLVAVFDNRSDAQNAMDELLGAGFARTDVNLSTADPSGQVDSTSGATERLSGEHEEGIGASIKHFFTGLFGSDNDEHATRYSAAVASGRHVVTLTTQSEPEVERAADIIERFGPVDIDERHDLSGPASTLGASALSTGAMGASSAGMQQSSSMSAQSGSLGSSMASGALNQSNIDDRSSLAPGALQNQQAASMQRDEDDLPFPAKQDLNDDVPRGTTYQESTGNVQSSGLSPASGSLQGTASLQGSNDMSLGGTVQQGNLSGQSMQRDTASLGQTGGAIPVVQEELKVGKRDVQRGGVRVYSRLVETPVDESVSLREEHVNVQRRPVDQPISTSDAAAFKEQSIELRENAEEAVVQKSARVVEEVVVGKDVSQRQENIHDTLRHTEVQVESLGDDSSFRNDWNSNYASLGGTYDDYAPAYRYGSESRSKYSGRNWDDVESDLRTDWDSRYGTSGGPSTWEKFKAAVRHGWDKITPDMDDDDDYYRNHWSNTYGTSGDTYNDYQPAYRYGNEMRRNPKYTGRNWTDVESDLRTDWDTRYGKAGEPSTWEKMKSAVRHGWDRMTS
ncbi:YsnF/AvaK domain-containing protein [Massilia sp. YIM B02763]|uniref:YsnF/AvaK domain-containing protein n=1 Tax=Massilia sp. YIM B02763 TaxID=3050130 RepID=UPI0025B681D2|nr:YsnF/AvaK domain-containing protein [Massilia sp. YIM B02763]MDN4053918.1 YsnF/AvaK domain-containing protein [Massilia sp. YIM B02763]